MLRFLAPLTILLLAFTPFPASAADPIIGQASVIDGDTIEIHGQRIRLHGIDAPESAQTCLVNGKQSRCGQQAAKALADRIGRLTVTCDPRDVDRYGRVVAVCNAGGEDLNGWMVRKGMALAYRQYSTDYVPQEKAASKAKVGIWRGSFVPPWEYRTGQRQAEEQSKPKASTNCNIKGNVSTRSGESISRVTR